MRIGLGLNHEIWFAFGGVKVVGLILFGFIQERKSLSFALKWTLFIFKFQNNSCLIIIYILSFPLFPNILFSNQITAIYNFLACVFISRNLVVPIIIRVFLNYNKRINFPLFSIFHRIVEIRIKYFLNGIIYRFQFQYFFMCFIFFWVYCPLSQKGYSNFTIIWSIYKLFKTFIKPGRYKLDYFIIGNLVLIKRIFLDNFLQFIKRGMICKDYAARSRIFPTGYNEFFCRIIAI